MMSFGRHWDPQRKYDVAQGRGGSEPPPIPRKFISLVETSLTYAQVPFDELPSMSPDVCTANFYGILDQRDLHQDLDESSDSLERGLPVVFISIGNSAEFIYGNEIEEEWRMDKVLLESGDVLIFGGVSRHLFHGVKHYIPESAPLPLIEETNLRPGRLNLTFRQY